MIIITIKQKDNTSLKKDPKGTIEIIDKNGKNATATKIYSKGCLHSLISNARNSFTESPNAYQNFPKTEEHST